MSKKLWVKYQSFNPVKVSTNDCEDVSDFIRACKKELSPHFDSFAFDQLFLTTTVGGTSIRPGLKLSELFTLEGYTVNDDEHPLFIDILPEVNSNILIFIFSYC